MSTTELAQGLAQEQAKVTDWPGYIGSAVGLLIVIGLVYWLMRQGWNWRRTLQSHIPELPAVPADPGEALLTASGRYHGTTTAGNWLDRVVAHGLGTRSLAELTLTEQGLLARRPGDTDLWIPAGQLTGARQDSGIAGKVVPAGLLVVTWTHHGTALDSGFRADHPDEHAAWVAAVDALVTRTTMKTEEAAQ
ncbi:PH-like domain-containing protein [Kitasatospora sp. McL0602]|uniref:PH-like domain-containing protein n=1 Tax=Kitasatospora sp. McL0602 TaxID=3439530 RepID=UPI003F8B3F1A